MEVEILVNVVIPYFYVYFDIFGKDDLSQKVLQLFNIFNQKSENKIVKEMLEKVAKGITVKELGYGYKFKKEIIQKHEELFKEDVNNEKAKGKMIK